MRSTALLAKVRRALEAPEGVRPGETILLGLSGGADSVALLDALIRLSAPMRFRVEAAHLDHTLREGSRDDAAFCGDLCRKLGVAVHQGSADVRGRARRNRGGLEQAAREERYAYLRSVKEAVGADALAVAHTRDDQAETVLLHLLRGAGGAGLTAMRPRTGDLLRPLLAVSRAEVLAHLRAAGLDWREDPTNGDPSLLRNRVRHELIPYLEARFNPRIRETLARTSAVQGDEQAFLAASAEGLFGEAVRGEGRGLELSGRILREAPRPLARLVLRRALAASGGLRGVRAVHVETLLDRVLGRASSARPLPLPGGREAVFRFGDVWLGPRRAPVAAFAVRLPVPGRVVIPGGLALVARESRGPAGLRGPSAVVPASGRLVVRTRRPGDRVRWRGRNVSLRRFLIERRVPADRRAGLPLVATGDRILWVPGLPLEAPPGGRRFVQLAIEGAP